MKNITDYKPFNGFYDLRDYNLPKKDFLKLWKIQEHLNHVETNKTYFKTMARNMWEDAKQLSAIYQQCLSSYSVQQRESNMLKATAGIRKRSCANARRRVLNDNNSFIFICSKSI